MTTFLWILALALPILPNLWSIWHAFTHEFPQEHERMRWLMLCVFLPVIGGLAYLARGRRRALADRSASAP